LDDRRRDGGTNLILRIKEQETRLTLNEHDDYDNDDDDDDDDDEEVLFERKHFFTDYVFRSFARKTVCSMKFSFI